MDNIIELIIDEDLEEAGIEAISVVENPAIKENFVFLSEQKRITLTEVDKEKGILMGPALIPNQKIYRQGATEEEDYYIFFSEETVRKASELFLKKNNQKNSTYEHQGEMLEDMTVVESWIIEDSKTDKSALYGYDLSEGTWMITVKTENEEIKQKARNGDIKGFSIEGYFIDKSEKLSLKSDGECEECTGECDECFKEFSAQIELEEALAALEEVEMESYGGYPESARNNAKLGIKRNEELGNKCATQVGKVRGQQLARGEKFTLPTLKRIYSYLSRAEAYYDPGKPEACGTISYLLWGGKSMKNWVESKLKGLDELALDVNPCQEGYEMIGFKNKNGRKVPNCVPKQ
jgi:hypothetical protein